jgi:hypothetical protein
MYSCSFYISELNNLKVIHDLYSQCLTRTFRSAVSQHQKKPTYGKYVSFANSTHYLEVPGIAAPSNLQSISTSKLYTT